MEMRLCQSRAEVTANRAAAAQIRVRSQGSYPRARAGWRQEGVLKGKLQRAAHARAAAAVGLHWPAHRNRTATALLAHWYGQGFSLKQTEGPGGRSLPTDSPL